jgi:hypothetical protein
MPGALAAPAASHAKSKKRTSVVTAGSPETPGIPRAAGFNGFLRGLPGEPGFLATIAGAMRKSIVADLTPASGCQDATTSPSAALSFVFDMLRPPHPAPNVQ